MAFVVSTGSSVWIFRIAMAAIILAASLLVTPFGRSYGPVLWLVILAGSLVGCALAARTREDADSR